MLVLGQFASTCRSNSGKTVNIMNHRTTRRQFIGQSAVLGSGFWISGSRRLTAGMGVKRGAGDTVNLGLIGCGHRGRQLLSEYVKIPGARVIAVCDVDGRRVAKARQEAGVETVTPYRDYRKLLENTEIDAVVVATGENWHCLMTIDACRAGKDVYVEKPIALTIGEGRAMIEASRKYDRVVQVGTQQRSGRHYREAIELIHSGRLGEISEVKVWDYLNRGRETQMQPDTPAPPELDWDLWLGPAPRVPYKQVRYTKKLVFFDYSGGLVTDWGVHHLDIVNWALGVKWPLSAIALGGNFAYGGARQNPDTFSGALEYGPGPVAKKGFVLQYTCRQGCRRDQISHGKCFFGTKASLLLHRGGYVITDEVAGGKVGLTQTPVDGEDYYEFQRRHLGLFLENVRNRIQPFANIDAGHYATMAGHLMNVAYRAGRKICWDGEREQVVNDPQANAMVTRQYRAPWKLEI